MEAYSILDLILAESGALVVRSEEGPKTTTALPNNQENLVSLSFALVVLEIVNSVSAVVLRKRGHELIPAVTCTALSVNNDLLHVVRHLEENKSVLVSDFEFLEGLKDLLANSNSRMCTALREGVS